MTPALSDVRAALFRGMNWVGGVVGGGLALGVAGNWISDGEISGWAAAPLPWWVAPPLLALGGLYGWAATGDSPALAGQLSAAQESVAEAEFFQNQARAATLEWNRTNRNSSIADDEALRGQLTLLMAALQRQRDSAPQISLWTRPAFAPPQLQYERNWALATTLLPGEPFELLGRAAPLHIAYSQVPGTHLWVVAASEQDFDPIERRHLELWAALTLIFV